MADIDRDRSLVSGFIRSLDQFPDRPALFVNGQLFNYLALAMIAGRIAATVTRNQDEEMLCAVFAHRSLSAYAGILGVLLSGRGYVPLNPKFPLSRTGKMLAQSDCSLLIVGQECLEELAQLLTDQARPLTLVVPEVSARELDDLAAQFPLHRFIAAGELTAAPGPPEAPGGVSADAIAQVAVSEDEILFVGANVALGDCQDIAPVILPPERDVLVVFVGVLQAGDVELRRLRLEEWRLVHG